MNDYRINRAEPRILTETEKKSIERRQKIALLYRAKEKIEDYQDDVFGIIDNDGLKNEDEKRRIETALKVLPFIVPQKRAVENTIITKKIEDIIQETIPEAEYEVIKPKNSNSVNSSNKQALRINQDG